MTEIILARHGETEWNVEEVFRGTIDIELNQTGISQAGLLAKYLSERHIDAVYSSPLQRALKTAEAIASNHGLSVEIAPGLIDFNFGVWQGLSLQEVRERYPELFKEWASHPDKVKIPGGESLNAVRKRAMSLVDKIAAGARGTVALVAHRVVNKVLICALLGLDNSHFWNIRQDNCGITTFTYEKGRSVLIEHNNTSFLNKKAPLGDF